MVNLTFVRCESACLLQSCTALLRPRQPAVLTSSQIRVDPPAPAFCTDFPQGRVRDRSPGAAWKRAGGTICHAVAATRDDSRRTITDNAHPPVPVHRRSIPRAKLAFVFPPEQRDCGPATPIISVTSSSAPSTVHCRSPRARLPLQVEKKLSKSFQV